jgi:predicted DCC family thiol-disulfide oxidoreductase YuxK
MNAQVQKQVVKDTLYFDGTCPLCSKEISLLKKLSKDQLIFADIQNISSTDTQLPSREALLRRLHLRLMNGEWLVGLDANVAVWSYTKYGFLFKILRWPLIGHIADRIYANWADNRYEKRYKCSQSN